MECCRCLRLGAGAIWLATTILCSRHRNHGRGVEAHNLGNIFLGGWEDLDVHDGGFQIRPSLRQLIKLSRARVVHFGFLGEVCNKLPKVGETAAAVDRRGSCNNSPGDNRRQKLGLGPAHRCDWPRSVVSVGAGTSEASSETFSSHAAPQSCSIIPDQGPRSLGPTTSETNLGCMPPFHAPHTSLKPTSLHENT